MAQIDFDEVETNAKATPVATKDEEEKDEGFFEGWTLKRALIISIPCIIVILGLVIYAYV